MFHKKYSLISALVLISPLGIAGPLDSPAPPTDPGSAMYSIDDVCNRLMSGAAGTKTPFANPTSGPSDIGCTLNDIMDKAPSKDNTNGVQPGEVIAGKRYWGFTDSNWGPQTGSLPNRGAVPYTCAPTDQAIEVGYHNGSVIKGDANLSPENIKQGVTIFGVTGAFVGTSAPASQPPTPTEPLEPYINTDSGTIQTEPSEPAPGTVFRDTLQDGSQGPEMVWIPAGSFRMGDIQGGGDSDEQPVHEVTVGRFAMGRYEVTFAEYDKFADATGREKPDDKDWGRVNQPVINVSWNDATAYVEWLSQQTGQQYHLPSEAEREYAARAGTETKYWWGNEIGSNQANCYGDGCGDSFKYTAPVGSFAANQFGLYDTVGNIWEWCADNWHDNYNGAPTDGSAWEGDDSRRVVRGSSWINDPDSARAASRGRVSPAVRNYLMGFRVVRRVVRNN